MSNPNFLGRVMEMIRKSVVIKLISIGILTLILLIPASMIESLISERRCRKIQAVNEISGKWGAEQRITGPIISAPFTRDTIDSKGKRHSVTEYIHILPDQLNFNGEIIPEIRYRGIYKTVLYNIKLKATGAFLPFKDKATEMANGDILWNKASISFGISDMKGIREALSFKLNKSAISLTPSGDGTGIIPCGVNALLKTFDPSQKQEFDIDLNLNGSHRISFIPLGRASDVTIKSTWDSPSFDGAYLPIERKVTKEGFTAKWKVFEFNRNYPQMWTRNQHKVDKSAFGVKLFIGNDIYNQSMRTVKYAILFIVFTFASIFIAEVINKTRVHPFQYLLTGCAVTIFYVLLISLSEHLSFGLAYLSAATAIVFLIFSYIKCFFTRIVMPIVIAAIQIMLYLYFYVTLQSEDYALLMGSLGLFAVLAAVMHVTRKINWHNLEYAEE